MNPTKDRKLMEKRSESLPPNFESLVDKNGQTVYKGFVFLPGTISDNIQQLKLHLPTGHLYCVKNDHCSTNGCPGMFNRRSHNAHPIYSRAKMHVEAFRWQVGLFLLHEGGRVPLKKAIEICFQDWPLELGINIVQLYDSLKTSLYTFQRASKEENGQSTFMKKSFLQEYPQKKLDRLIAALKLNIHYWGPYTGPKPAVEKEKSVLPTGKRRRRERSLPSNFESLVDKNGQTVYQGFVFLPGRRYKDHFQQLKLHLPTGHLYFMKDDHCPTHHCPGMFNRRSHNAHPIYSRAKWQREAFRWQVNLFLLHEGGRVTPKKAIEICLQEWPLELGKDVDQLYNSLIKSLKMFKTASKEENGLSAFKKSFLQEYPQEKLDRFIAALKLNTHYWGPYTGPKPAVEKEKSVLPTGKRRRENVSPQRSSGSFEKEMNPQKKARQETDKDPKGVKISRSSGNAKEKIGETISSSNKSKDKASPRVPEEQVEFSVAPFANNCSSCNRDSSSNVFIDKKGKTVFLWPVCCTVCSENWNVHSIEPYRLECVQLKTELSSGEQNSDV